MASREIIIKIRHMREVDKIEKHVLKWITPEMNGLDIGSGGAPILIQAIGIDKSSKAIYSDYVHLKGNAGNLYWFKDNCMDYIFSSHCFEDFSIKEKPEVFKEWIRVLKLGGLLILYLPNEKAYRAYCKAHKAVPNRDHQEENFSIESVRKIAKQVGQVKEEFAIPKHGDYCFFIVFRKVE